MRLLSMSRLGFRIRRSRAMLVVVLLAGALSPSRLSAQIRTDRIRGRITIDSMPATGAIVIATRAPDRAFFRVTSDSGGKYEIRVDSGTGDYLVHASIPSRVEIGAFRRRVTRMLPDDSVFVVDVQFVSRKAPVQALATIKVEAARRVVSRTPDDPAGGGTGGASSRPSGFHAALSPDQRGDVAAMALSVPGVVQTSDGFSVLGVPNSQNGTVLNGMAFAGGVLPRDAAVTARVATTAYDPALGWFGGAQTQLDMGAGGLYSRRFASIVLDAPFMQATDPVAARLTPTFNRLQAGYSAMGAALHDRLTYNVAVDMSRRRASVLTLADLDAAALGRNGVARDTAAALLQRATAAGIPLSARSVNGSKDVMSFLARINTPDVDLQTYSPRNTSVGVIIYGFRSTNSAIGTSALATSASAFGASSSVASIQGQLSSFVRPWLLADVRSSLSSSEQRSSSRSHLPAALVQTVSDFPDEQGGLATLQLGGPTAAGTRYRTTTWETQAETKLVLPAWTAHQLKLNADVRYDAVERRPTGADPGTFLFNSPADFAANRPAAFQRVLEAPARTGGEWNGFVAASDAWTPIAGLRLLYGMRIEANRYSHRPVNDRTIESLFGTRTDFAPTTVHASPRLGFTWRYDRTADENPGATGYSYGVFGTPAGGVLRGGIGEFRTLLSPALLATGATDAGLDGGARFVNCVGDDVPTPDWLSYSADAASVPRSCGTTSEGGAGLGAAPRISFISRGFTAPRVWRANLSWVSNWPTLSLTVEAVTSLGVNQPGMRDLNLVSAPRFTLADEGRAVFVPAERIAVSTGALTWDGSRRIAAYGTVLEQVSELRSRASQLTFRLAPDVSVFRKVVWTLSYTFARARAEQSGLDGSTFDSPTIRAWSRANTDVRHTIIASIGRDFGKFGSVSMFSRFMSGRPFTPMIASDVNGDGFANDRAFIFDPAVAGSTSTSSTAVDLQRLVAGASRNVRQCLERQLGRPAAANSCEGPWTTFLSAQVSVNPRVFGSRIGLHLTHLNVAIDNPLGGLDELLHGRNLRGWGNPTAPDPTLYRVRGFDASARRYEYQVNPRFGDTRPANTAIRAPFRVSVEARLNLSTPVAQQQVHRFLSAGRNGNPGKRLTVADLKRRYARNVPDLYGSILAESDSLLLKNDQVRALMQARAQFAGSVDSAWTSLATWMADLPDRFEAKAALARQEDQTDAVWELWRQELRASLPRILSAQQLRLLPDVPNRLMRSTVPVKGLRIYATGR